ncbi:MAG: carbohydrate kinase family protein [Erysipelotrichaceae bacterium]|nr:carbohydrate kinase family protein [Erysipelotrichaceae bacterium]
MFFVIGGANIDIYCKSNRELIMKDSNPCKMTFTHGGVARNIAENLRFAGEDVSFMTAFGDDYFADALINELMKRDIDLSFAVRCKGFATSTYMAVLNVDDLFLGMNDMSVISQLTKENIDFLAKYVKDEDYLIFDTNLDRELIEYILDTVKGTKICDAISANKVVKLKGLTGKLDTLKLNLLEAEALSGKPLFIETETIDYIKQLLREGTGEVLITGKNFLFVGNEEGVHKYIHNAYREAPVNVTGAGDSLIAYYAHAKARGLGTDEAAKLGIVASILTVDTDMPVREMTVNFVREEAEKISIEKENY